MIHQSPSAAHRVSGMAPGSCTVRLHSEQEMIDSATQQQILDLIHREVVPAVGCTEPMAVALCTARATELLGCRPDEIEVLLSANILKNAMGVGIPGTGMIGLPIAVALGALIGKSEYQLEVIKDLTPESLEEGKKYISEKRINIGLKPGRCDKLYVEVTCKAHGSRDKATAIIARSHTNFVYEELNGSVKLDTRGGGCEGGAGDDGCGFVAGAVGRTGHFDIKLIAFAGLQSDVDAVLTDIFLAFLQALGGKVLDDFQLVFRLSDEGSQGDGDGQSDHARSGNADTHGVFQDVGREQDINFFGAGAKEFCSACRTERHSHRFCTSYRRHHFAVDKVKDLLLCYWVCHSMFKKRRPSLSLSVTGEGR